VVATGAELDAADNDDEDDDDNDDDEEVEVEVFIGAVLVGCESSTMASSEVSFSSPPSLLSELLSLFEVGVANAAVAFTRA
jgi:hypothetical protein